MKKIVSVCMLVVMALCFTGCGGNDGVYSKKDVSLYDTKTKQYISCYDTIEEVEEKIGKPLDVKADSDGNYSFYYYEDGLYIRYVNNIADTIGLDRISDEYKERYKKNYKERYKILNNAVSGNISKVEIEKKDLSNEMRQADNPGNPERITIDNYFEKKNDEFLIVEGYPGYNVDKDYVSITLWYVLLDNGNYALEQAFIMGELM